MNDKELVKELVDVIIKDVYENYPGLE